MEKEKRIEEMAKTLCANCRKDGYSCSLYSSDDDWVCVQERERAEFFYNAGYRKQEDILHEWVERETAYLKEIAELKKKVSALVDELIRCRKTIKTMEED